MILSVKRLQVHEPSILNYNDSLSTFSDEIKLNFEFSEIHIFHKLGNRF